MSDTHEILYTVGKKVICNILLNFNSIGCTVWTLLSSLTFKHTYTHAYACTHHIKNIVNEFRIPHKVQMYRNLTALLFMITILFISNRFSKS